MSTYCQELNHKITYGDPFFIITTTGVGGGVIVSMEAINRIPKNEQFAEQLVDLVSFDVFAATSSYSMGNTYAWTDITKGEYLFSINSDVFSSFFPTCKAMFSSKN
jgi:hypothetical protein